MRRPAPAVRDRRHRPARAPPACRQDSLCDSARFPKARQPARLHSGVRSITRASGPRSCPRTLVRPTRPQRAGTGHRRAHRVLGRSRAPAARRPRPCQRRGAPARGRRAGVSFRPAQSGTMCSRAHGAPEQAAAGPCPEPASRSPSGRRRPRAAGRGAIPARRPLRARCGAAQRCNQKQPCLSRHGGGNGVASTTRKLVARSYAGSIAARSKATSVTPLGRNTST